MPSQHLPSVDRQTLEGFWLWRLCVFYSVMCLPFWLTCSEASRLRCGSDLLADLIFVCGDRGIYLGKGNWSGYGSRPRGKGIVDRCCQSAGCDLQHLEMYCAKPKELEQYTTASTTTPQPTTKEFEMKQQFKAVFQRKFLENLGTPNSHRRHNYRRKPSNSRRRKNQVLSHRRMPTPQTTGSPLSSF